MNGGGGTALVGGRGGICVGIDGLCTDGSPGFLGQGGNGGSGIEGHQGAAGGGGGYYGGGGGGGGLVTPSDGGAGGGGSGFVSPGAEGASTEAGVRAGDGLVQISYAAPVVVYSSTYTQTEVAWLYIDAVQLQLGASDTQHQATMFMVFLAGLVNGQGQPPPDLGTDLPTVPFTVTSGYTAAERDAVVDAAALFSTDPETLQRRGVALLASLFSL